MASETLYAWSPIRYGAELDKDGNFLKVKTLEMGATVTSSKLGVSDEELQSLVESGAVRNYKVPEMPDGYAGSVVDHLRNEAERAQVLGLATSLGGSPFGPTTEEVMLSPDFTELRESTEPPDGGEGGTGDGGTGDGGGDK